MATRRPPMPRSGSSKRDPQRAAEPAPAPEATSPNHSAEAAPRRPRVRREEPAPRASASGSAPSAPRPKVVPLGPVQTGSKPVPGARKPAAAASKPAPARPAGAPKTGPKTSAKTSGPAAAKPKSKPKAKATASQRRIEDRNLLSGAVRKDEKAAQKTERKGPAGPKIPIPARSFSGRLLALSIALSVFAVLLVPSIGTYARQRDEIEALRTSIAAKQAEQEALKDQIARWDDPLYIKQQARDRINLVMPGERNYMVVGAAPDEDLPGEANQSPAEVRTDLPWVDALFDSVQRAATD